MATDARRKKVVFPCNPSTIEGINNALLGAANGKSDAVAFLRRATCQISKTQIPWQNLRYLGFLGKTEEQCNYALAEAGFRAGIYINRHGTALILIRLNDTLIQSCLEHCADSLQILAVCNTNVSALNISRFEHLAKFCAIQNSSLVSLTGLKNLAQLTTLNLSWCYELTALPGLENLTQLTSLDCSYCFQLTSLPELKRLTQLAALDLTCCSNLKELPELMALTQLISLNLSWCESLTALPGLENLTQLTDLNLSWCKSLTALPGLKNLTQLTHLNLAWCRSLPVLPKEIRQLKSLRRINLQDMHFLELPDWLPEVTERFSIEAHDSLSGTNGAVVNLHGTTVDGMDMSIFERTHEMILKWFEAHKKGNTQPLNEMKVIFLGDGEAGKSYTISRLMNNGGDPLDYEGVRTPGIAIKSHRCQFNDRSFQVNYWDFGGQEIMHAMHRVFLTNRTMYVVLVSAEAPNPQERAEFWLHNIKSFAPEAPVLLAINKVDIRPKLSLNTKALRTANSNLKQIVSMSALEFDQEKFNSDFRSVLLQEIVNTGMLDVAWPKSWIELKSRMETIQAPHISVRDYVKICKLCQVEDVQIELLHWFHDLGVSFCFRDNFKLKNQIILQPKWITNGLYIILFNECKGVVGGIVPHESIHELLEKAPDYPFIKCTDPSAEYEIPRDAEYVLGIMRQFGLSQQIGEDREFIPMLCQKYPTFDLAAYETDEAVLEFHMEFEYLPNNVLHQLMVKQYSELDPENVWRGGAQFQQPGTALSAIVVMDENTLKFYISHSDPRYSPQTYLTVLKAKVDQIWQNMGLQEPEEAFVYKTAGSRETVGYEELKHSLKKGDDELYARSLRRSIPISDLLRQFGLEELAEHEHPPLRNRRISCPNKRTSPIDEWKLLEYIVESCQKIQADPIYGATGDKSGKEDERNRRIRDDLEYRLKNTGYRISDQPQQGRSGTGQGVGELDLLLKDEQGRLWTIIEALRVHNIDKIEWKKHLTKLLGNYNYGGLHFAYLLTYVDSNAADFMKIWGNYQRYIPTYDPGEYSVDPNSFQPLNAAQDLQYIQTAMCRYTCGSAQVTVYHLFVMVRPQPPKTDSIPKSSVK